MYYQNDEILLSTFPHHDMLHDGNYDQIPFEILTQVSKPSRITLNFTLIGIGVWIYGLSS